MNIQAKSSFLIVFTLLIGIVLGVLIDRTMIHRSFEKRIERMQSPGIFRNNFERLIEPSASQSVIVKQIVEKYSKKLFEHSQQTRQEMAAIMDSLKTELEPILTPEQKERFEQRLHRMGRRPFGRPGRKPGRRGFDEKPGPPPPDVKRKELFFP
jgi:hypothetical protein